MLHPASTPHCAAATRAQPVHAAQTHCCPHSPHILSTDTVPAPRVLPAQCQTGCSPFSLSVLLVPGPRSAWDRCKSKRAATVSRWFSRLTAGWCGAGLTRLVPGLANVVGAAAHLLGHVEGELVLTRVIVVAIADALPHVCKGSADRVSCQPQEWVLPAPGPSLLGI